MYETEEDRLFRRAAQPTLEAIEWLKKRVPKTLEPVVEQIEANVFTPRYTIAKLMQDLQLKSKRFMTTFGKAVGLTPWGFIRACRLETAARLLRDTPLPLVEITLLVGYDSERAFSDLFQSWCGMRPKPYRRHARAAMACLAAPPEEIFSWSRWQSLCQGDLGAEACEELLVALEHLGEADPQA